MKTLTGLTPSSERDPIVDITIFDDKIEPVRAFRGVAEETIKGFVEQVRLEDPDFLVAPECDELTIPYITERARRIGIEGP